MSKRTPKALQKSKRQLSIGKVFFTLGFLLVISSVGIKLYDLSKLSFTTAIPNSEVTTKSRPINLLVAGKNIDLPVFETEIKDGLWQVHAEGVSHLANTDYEIFYAHNTANRFGFLSMLKPDEVISIKNDTNETKDYVVYEIKTVNPTEVEELLSDNENEIVLYTCTGFADTKRLVVKAKAV